MVPKNTNIFSMNQSAISLAIIVITLIAVAIVFYCVKPKKKLGTQLSDSQNVRRYQILSIIDRFNMYIDDYNRVCSDFAMQSGYKQRQIAAVSDLKSYEKLKMIENQFNLDSRAVSGYIRKIRACVEENNFNDIDIYLESVANGVEQLSFSIDRVKQINPSVTNYSFDQEDNKSKEGTHTVSTQKKELTKFFDGCKTKEEADKRYKNLSKAFHPDAEWGNSDMFTQMDQEYHSLKFN